MCFPFVTPRTARASYRGM
uniref:Uncharacterized protein n=1 Tax=Anguilla anguilla TaxID=7936 RepID=A0A0E9R235_ANGAN